MLVVHTREGHDPDLSDLPPNKRWRSAQIGAEIGAAGPCGRILVRGEPGWEIVPEVAPVAGEVDRRQAGQGRLLRHQPRPGAAHPGHHPPDPDRHHHRRLRAHHDARGQRPWLRVPDPVGLHRRHRPANHDAALHMVTMQGGVFGCVATSADVIAATRQVRSAHVDHRRRATRTRTPSTPRPPRWSSSTCSATSCCPADSARPSATTSRQLQPVVAAARGAAARRPEPSGLIVIHTREGHLPDLSDCPPAKLSRGEPTQRIGDPGPNGRILIRGEYGHDIIDELAPIAGEIVIDKPGKGAFYATELQRRAGTRRASRSLIVTGVTTEVCVHTTVREANDRGYECLVLVRLRRLVLPRVPAGRPGDDRRPGRHLRLGRRLHRRPRRAAPARRDRRLCKDPS